MNVFISTIMLFIGYTTPYISLPPSWENRVIYYQSFEQEDNKAEINNPKLEISEMMNVKSGGNTWKMRNSISKIYSTKGKSTFT